MAPSRLRHGLVLVKGIEQCQNALAVKEAADNPGEFMSAVGKLQSALPFLHDGP